jgi:hypothetical protein
VKVVKTDILILGSLHRDITEIDASAALERMVQKRNRGDGIQTGLI